MIDCAIIIVSYRSAGDIPTLLTSLPLAAGPLTFSVIVINNDPREDLEAALGYRTDVTIVNAGANIGYSGGLNLGLSLAPPSRFRVFLNPDLALEPGSLLALVDACASDDIAAAVPLIVDANGERSPSLRHEPSLSGAIGEALLGDHWPSRPKWLSEMVRDPERYRTASPIDWATGAALVVRSSTAAAVGEWDADRFFLYSEETDFFRRIRSTGKQIWFVPEAVVRHRGAGSGSSAELDALLAVNKVRYYRKWHGAGSSVTFLVVCLFHNLVRIGRPSARSAAVALLSRRARAKLPGGVS